MCIYIYIYRCVRHVKNIKAFILWFRKITRAAIVLDAKPNKMTLTRECSLNANHAEKKSRGPGCQQETHTYTHGARGWKSFACIPNSC